MSLDLVAEVWDVLKSHIATNEHDYAADDIVNFLIDNGFEPDDIKDSFSGNKVIMKALTSYLHDDDIGDDDYDDDEWE